MDYEKKYREAQKWIESIYSELSHEQQMEAEAFFPELKESEDEKMMHQLHSWMKEFGGAEEYTEKVYTWLKSLLEKQGEQEPTDKIEPKFKVGDWIISNNKKSIYQVIEVKRGIYVIRDNADNYEYHIGIEECEKSGKLFTIQDAKDGDVLVCPLPKGCESGEQIFIFKGINSRDYVDNCIEYYCRICDGVFYVNENGYMGTTSSPLYPATKEQRDLLFQKMKEAGYEWDAEKKELKRIEDEEYNGEDYGIDSLYHAQRILEKTLGSVDGYQTDDGILSHKCAITAVKKLYEQKPAWSEEDETGWTNTMIMIKEVASNHYTKDSIKLVIDWLKSLKERYTWKPSEEQIECLYDAINHYQTNGYPASKLNELYEQMSKIYKL